MRDISQIRGIKTEGISADLRTEIYISADYADRITQISFRDSGYTSELKNIVYVGLADSVLP